MALASKAITCVLFVVALALLVGAAELLNPAWAASAWSSSDLSSALCVEPVMLSFAVLFVFTFREAGPGRPLRPEAKQCGNTRRGAGVRFNNAKLIARNVLNHCFTIRQDAHGGPSRSRSDVGAKVTTSVSIRLKSMAAHSVRRLRVRAACVVQLRSWYTACQWTLLAAEVSSLIFTMATVVLVTDIEPEAGQQRKLSENPSPEDLEDLTGSPPPDFAFGNHLVAGTMFFFAGALSNCRAFFGLPVL
mmetsp:Transcript_47092/g.131370  ORF Transcript_47092/g.131370 Transcript_47092/m.131370 type:complete len:247 (+) Transcript_47092:83-823(+)